VSKLGRMALVVISAFLLPHHATAQGKQYALESAEGLVLQNVAAEPVTHQGKKGLKLTLADEAKRQLERLTPEERNQRFVDQLAQIKDLQFSSGDIEVELAGAPAPDAPPGARGFVGIAFRVQPDHATYDAFYLRPTNGRADDQERRNRSVQYISQPEWPWFRLRKETPAKYEAYVDLVPGEWTRIKIEVRGDRARLYVHGSEQPTLLVNDVKTGAQATGGVALWLDTGTIAHFRNLTVNAVPSR
jgi:hypothetical protein